MGLLPLPAYAGSFKFGTMKNKPLVSVVMSVFNDEKYIKRAIESILNQTLKKFEFIIINDASKDTSLEIIRSFTRKDKRIKLINNTQELRLASSINLGVSIAKADFIARMDPDDISLPERLEIQYIYFKKHPNIAVVGTNLSIVNENMKEISVRNYPTHSEDLKKIMLRYSPFAHPSVMLRKKVFKEFGGYDPNMKLCEDIDFWFKLGTKYDFGNIPERLVQYTLSEKSGTHRNIRQTELLGFKIKLNAIIKHGYKPGLYDIFYNVLQFITMWIMPTGIRIKLYNEIRSRGII